MKSWKTTVSGALGALGVYLTTDTDPRLQTTGKVLTGVGILFAGVFARDNNVTSEQAGAGGRDANGVVKAGLFLLAGLLMLGGLTGCISPGNKAVATNKIKWNPTTSDATLEFAQDASFANATVTRNGSNASVTISGWNSANNPAALSAGFTGQVGLATAVGVQNNLAFQNFLNGAIAGANMYMGRTGEPVNGLAVPIQPVSLDTNTFNALVQAVRQALTNAPSK